MPQSPPPAPEGLAAPCGGLGRVAQRRQGGGEDAEADLVVQAGQLLAGPPDLLQQALAVSRPRAR